MTIAQHRFAPIFVAGAMMASIALAASLYSARPQPTSAVMVPAVASRGESMVMPGGSAFLENRGQWDAQAQYMAQTAGSTVWITEAGVVYDFNRMERNGAVSKRRGHVVRMEFVGAQPSAIRGDGQLDGTFNFLVGDRSRWATNVPHYSEVKSERIYDGVQARYYFDQGRPRYDLILSPGADPATIKLRFAGATGLSAQGESLTIGTSLGDVEQRGLYAYQSIGGKEIQVPCSFRTRGNVVTFETGTYDRSKPLVIDPVVWGTFLGGDSDETARDVELAGPDHLLVAGTTNSSAFPTTVGAYDVSVSSDDFFVAKLTRDGTSLAFATFLGGSSGETCVGLAQDSTGKIILAGTTNSNNFPTSIGAFDSTYNGDLDGAVATLSADGTALHMGTYLGGTTFDALNDVDVDSLDRPVVAGVTGSSNFPVTPGAFQTTRLGSYDGFVVSLAASGASLAYSTLLGGSADDGLTALVLDPEDRPYVTGYSISGDYPTTAGAFDVTDDVYYDVVVSRLSATGASLVASTYLAGNAYDTAQDIVLDSSGRVVVTGNTASTNFPTTLGTFDTTVSAYDAFVTRLSANLTVLNMGTLIGGSNVDYGQGLAFDELGNIVLVGYSASTDFPTTPGAQDQANAVSEDAFVAKLSTSGVKLIYSTYLGGDLGSDKAWAAVSLPKPPYLTGAMVVAGVAVTGFPSTAGSFDATFNGGVNDAFVVHLATGPAVKRASLLTASQVGGFQAKLTVELSQPADKTLQVNLSTSEPTKFLVPATLQFSAGQISKTIGVKTATVTVTTPFTVTASYNGGTSTVNANLIKGGLLSVVLTGTSMAQNTNGSGTVNLSGPAQNARLVTLSSNKPAVLSPDASTTVAKSATSANFNMVAGAVAVPTLVSIKGSLGSVSKTDTMTVNP